jgi:peptidyl-prolyl cis-trans isomerase C
MNRNLAAFAFLILVSACAKQAAPVVEAEPKANIVATVNGTKIDRNTFNFYVKGIAGKAAEELTAEQRAQLLDNLVRGELVAADAEKNGIAKQDETKAIMALSRLTVLQQASTQQYLKDRKATEQEIKAEYEVQIKTMPQTEYHARHIQVATEEIATSVIKQLDSGASFERLAKKESLDATSKVKGGDLDWVTPDRMANPFGQALLALKKGEHTKVPVQSQYGWHVIRLDDTRPLAAPPFESVKDRLTQIVEAKKFTSYTDELVKTAKIEKTL